MLLGLLDRAVGRQAREATLEVRLSNVPARRLYEKYGFRPVGIRPRYYSDNGEDALIMTTEQGKPLAEARTDMADAAASFDYYADLAVDLDSRQDKPVAVADPALSKWWIVRASEGKCIVVDIEPTGKDKSVTKLGKDV